MASSTNPMKLYVVRLEKLVTLKDICPSATRLCKIPANTNVKTTRKHIATTITSQLSQCGVSGRMVMVVKRRLMNNTIQHKSSPLMSRSPSELNTKLEL